jgi:hypothetical protein
MGFEHTKGKLLPPKNERTKKKSSKSSCSNCRWFIQFAKVDSFGCRRPQSAQFVSEREASNRVCDRYKYDYYLLDNMVDCYLD